MNIKILFLRNSLVAMGEINETENDFWIRNPIEVITRPSTEGDESGFSISFAPLFHYTEDAKGDGIKISKTEVLSEMTPINQLKEHYTKFFNINE